MSHVKILHSYRTSCSLLHLKYKQIVMHHICYTQYSVLMTTFVYNLHLHIFQYISHYHMILHWFSECYREHSNQLLYYLRHCGLQISLIFFTCFSSFSQSPDEKKFRLGFGLLLWRYCRVVLDWQLQYHTHTHTHTHIYIYIYIY